MNILLVEPDYLLATTYRRALGMAGHNVYAASTAQEAVHMADENMPDLVILEMQLVSHSGVEFLYEFRSYSDWQDTPVMILSNVPAAEFAASQKFLKEELGVVAYHYKPRTSLRTLLQAVSKIPVEAA